VRWSGVRAIAFGRPGRLRLAAAGDEDVTDRFKEIRRLSRQLGARDAVLDGVIRTQAEPVTYAIFDLLYLEGRDLMGEPYSERRRLLRGLGLDGERWQTPSHSVGHARELLAASREQGLGGLVLKRLGSRYEPGRRADSWRRVE
jgi:bifunctional non-homologous end joining protein LigD